MQTISSGLITGNTKRPQDTKEARNMALLLNREVVGITRSIKIQVMPALLHGHRLTRSNTTIYEISYVSRFSEQIADAIILPIRFRGQHACRLFIVNTSSHDAIAKIVKTSYPHKFSCIFYKKTSFSARNRPFWWGTKILAT